MTSPYVNGELSKEEDTDVFRKPTEASASIKKKNVMAGRTKASRSYRFISVLLPYRIFLLIVFQKYRMVWFVFVNVVVLWS